MKTYQKVLAVAALFILLFITAIHIYSTYYLEDQIRSTLIAEINSRADGKYNFSAADLNLSFIKRTIRLDEISITTTEQATHQIRADIRSTDLSGIGLRKLLFSREISIDKIYIEEPTVAIHHTAAGNSNTDDAGALPGASETGSSILSNLSIPEIEIADFDLSIYRHDEQTPYLSFSNSDVTLLNILINEATENRNLPFSIGSGTFRDIAYLPEGGLYSIRAASASFSSLSETAMADSVLLTPLLEPSLFFDTVGYRTDRMTGSIHSVNMDGLDVTSLLNDGILVTENVYLEQPVLTLFRNKNYPRRENRSDKPLPQELLRELNIPVMMNLISIDNGSVRYSEIAENATDSGYIEFSELNARLLNTTNIDSLIEKNSNWTLEANTRVMDSGQLDVSFQLPLNEEYHTINGRLQNMNATDLNHALEPIASVRIESGNISALRFEMRLNKSEALGFLEVIYDDLKISVLDGDSGGKNLRSRITSFLANTLKIKSDNLAENPRMGTINFQREPDKSFFNYWWKSLRTGLKTSVGLEN